MAVLTTDTPHHRFFLRELDRLKPNGVELGPILFETKGLPAKRLACQYTIRNLPRVWNAIALNPYVLMGIHAKKILAYEYEKFFPDGDDSLPTHITTTPVFSINDQEVRERLTQAAPDLAFVYGTGRINREIFEIARIDTINAHGGLLPNYRGLDTNLWAALEGHPEDMAVAFHRMDDDFDTGPVYLQRRLGPIPELTLISLRFHTTLISIDMCLDLLSSFSSAAPKPNLIATKNSSYYRPMPALLKARANRAIRDFSSTGTTAS